MDRFPEALKILFWLSALFFAELSVTIMASPHKSLSILQWNCRSLRTNVEELRGHLSQSPADVLCLQSVGVAHQGLPTLEGYSYPPVSVARSGNRVMSAIYLRSGLILLGSGVWTGAVPDGVFVSSVRLEGTSGGIGVLNVYAPRGVTSFDWLRPAAGASWVVLGDFNIRDSMWDEGCLTHRGSFVEELEAGELVILNEGAPTRVPDAECHGPSAIDLALVSEGLAASAEWDRGADTLGSDHFPILVSVALEPKREPVAGRPRYRYDKANWDAFQAYLEQAALVHATSSDPDEEARVLTECIIGAADASIPKSKGTLSRKGVPWWTKECLEAVRNKRRCYNRYLRTRSSEDHLAMKASASAVKKVIAGAKRDYILSCSHGGSISDTWEGLKKLRGTWRPASRPITLNGVHLTTDQAKGKAYRDFFESSGLESELPADARERRGEIPDLPDPSSIPADGSLFTSRDFALAILKIKGQGSSPGLDGVTYPMLKRLPPSFRALVLRLFNLCWTTLSYPVGWRRSVVVPIPKKGKPRTSMDGYRPVSLTSCVGKLYERLVHVRLEGLCQRTGAIPPSQAGFRRGRSTRDLCVSLAERLRRARARGHVAIACFYDLSRAFDTVWHPKLLERLHTLGASRELFGFTKAFLSDRTFQVRWGQSLSTEGRTDMGVPQGSIVSPLLFIALLSDPGLRLRGSSIISTYADDICLFRTTYAKRCRKVNRRLSLETKRFQEDSDTVVEHLEELGFIVNEAKTIFMVFNATLLSDLSLEVGYSVLTPQKEVVYLGVVFTYTLSWTPHVNRVLAGAHRAVNLIRSSLREPWGKSRKHGVLLVQALVRSRLGYGLETARDVTATDLKRMVACECNILRRVLGLPNGTPQGLVYREAGILPLWNRARLSMAKFCAGAAAGDGPARDVITDESLEVAQNQKGILPLPRGPGGRPGQGGRGGP